MPPFDFDDEPASLVYLINLTAGLMDGDGHVIEIKARAGSRSVVTGQSATRVHPASIAFGTQQWAVEVENDACLLVLPGPVIPFRGCRYYQCGRANLSPRARLIWGEIWLAGRYDRGELSERFQFERIVQDFEACRAGRVIYRERFCWDGPWSAEDAAWYFGGELAAASLLVAGTAPEFLPDPRTNVRRAVFRLDSGDLCVRWCGQPPAVTADLVRVALHVAGWWTVGDERKASPWLIASGALAPNHWFSTGA